MDKNSGNKQRRGPKPKNLITDSPFSITLSRILRKKNEPNSIIEARGNLSGGTLKNVLQSGNPTLATAWAIEDALELPRGTLCAPHSVVTNQVPTCETKKSPPAEASGGQERSKEIIESVFRVQEALSAFGQHLVRGQSAKAFPELRGLRGTVQGLQEQLATLQQPPEAHDRTA